LSNDINSYVNNVSQEFTSGTANVKQKVSNLSDSVWLRGVQTYAYAIGTTDIGDIVIWDGSAGPEIFRVPISYRANSVANDIIPDDCYIKLDNGLYVSGTTDAIIQNLYISVFYT